MWGEEVGLRWAAIARSSRHLTLHFQYMNTRVGFCRNCLGKWVTVASRDVAREGAAAGVMDESTMAELLGAEYQDYCGQVVYGEDYAEWKRKHHTKPSDEQMVSYKLSTWLHAEHDKERLKAEVVVLPSEVCCTDTDENGLACELSRNPVVAVASVPFPVLKDTEPLNLIVNTLTCSDRAYRNEYASGDLSGPAVEAAFGECLRSAKNPSADVINVNYGRKIVEDDEVAIRGVLMDWAADKEEAPEAVRIIFTTGGTGFGPRDVTPEATRSIITKDCSNLLQHALLLCSKKQPLACLSRGIAGTLADKCIVVNLPGQPQACKDVVENILPGLLHWAVQQK